MSLHLVSRNVNAIGNNYYYHSFGQLCGEMVQKLVEGGKTMENENKTPDVIEDESKTEPEEKTYTQAELDSQISKSVESALSRRDKKHESEMQSAISKAVEEALNREKMSDEERFNEDLKARELEIERREKEAFRREFRAKVLGDLNEEGLPTSFADLIINSSDMETSDELILNLKKEIDSIVQVALKEYARQPEPKTSETSTLSQGSSSSIQGNLSKFAEENRKGVK